MQACTINPFTITPNECNTNNSNKDDTKGCCSPDGTGVGVCQNIESGGSGNVGESCGQGEADARFCSVDSGSTDPFIPCPEGTKCCKVSI